jgi:predicted O-methyltransferase YrrM
MFVTDSYYHRELIAFWRYVAYLPSTSFVDTLRGTPLPQMPIWPPQTTEAAQHLETWMTVTSTGSIKTIKASKAMEGAKRLLDVGGGDGTTAIALFQAYKDDGFTATVFNLPASASLAIRNIQANGLTDKQVNVCTGDFLQDELPQGYDRVMFSRVMTDWTPDVVRSLMLKAKRALSPGGRLVINEFMLEGNADACVAWEFRYIFYDSFGRFLFKPLELYLGLLEETGFKVVNVSPMLDDAFYSVIEAEVCQV